MKGQRGEEREHRVPLSDAALQVLKALPRGRRDAFVFVNAGERLSGAACGELIQRMHAASLKRGGAGYLDPKQNRVVTPHGTARSSFKDWARHLPREKAMRTRSASWHWRTSATTRRAWRTHAAISCRCARI